MAEASVDEAAVLVDVPRQPQAHARLEYHAAPACVGVAGHAAGVQRLLVDAELPPKAQEIQVAGRGVRHREKREILPGIRLLHFHGVLDRLAPATAQAAALEESRQHAPGRLSLPHVGQEIEHYLVRAPGERVLPQFHVPHLARLRLRDQGVLHEGGAADGLQLLEIPNEDNEWPWAQLAQGRAHLPPDLVLRLRAFVEDQQVEVAQAARRDVLGVGLARDLEAAVDGLHHDVESGRQLLTVHTDQRPDGARDQDLAPRRSSVDRALKHHRRLSGPRTAGHQQQARRGRHVGVRHLDARLHSVQDLVLLGRPAASFPAPPCGSPCSN